MNETDEIENYSIGKVLSLDELIQNGTDYYEKWLFDNKELCQEYVESEEDEKYELLVLMREPISDILPIIDCIYYKYNTEIEKMIHKFISSYSF